MRWIGWPAGMLLLLAACGGEGQMSARSIRLHVEIQAGDEAGTLLTGLLICGGDDARGTGMFENPADAASACAAIRSNGEIRRLLLEGPSEDRACTQVYGGPQRAAVGGIIDGSEVDLRIDRTDGCGIADWELLEPVIGPPPAAEPGGG